MSIKTELDKVTELDRVISSISFATEENAHNLARQILARYLGSKALSKAYKYVEELHLIIGHMPESLIEFRRELDIQLIKEAEKQCPDDIERINNAF